MVKTLFLMFFSFSLTTSNLLAQNNYKKWEKDSLLTWSDFKGTLDTPSSFGAMTNWHMPYSYHWSLKNGIYTLKFKVEGAIDRSRSWSKADKQTNALLAHEQLHFDISEIFARELFIELNKKAYTANYKNEVLDIVASVFKSATEMQQKYDEETDHSKNKIKQAEWELYVKHLLETAPEIK
ncbi:DUF922 domain-containing protein [Mucilaginibacter sp. PPCGB 2223]|uniref:DUF922 domain-containing protein n=1 Tax=Mucilaginibacter sp. PPCGB 2223 TaxID=1886027 RepID=UPI0015869305|nr:DUF922 domain-containing protein [Mucilaginibacter sp. PPCGB 2223]